MAMQQEPIYWRYRFHICLAYFSGLNFREYPHNSYGQQYGTVPPFEDPESFPLNVWGESPSQPFEQTANIV